MVAGEIVVHGHHVDTPGRNGVQVRGQSRHEGLSLTGLHFSDIAPVEGPTTHDLNVKVPKSQGPLRRFTDCGKGLGEQFLERFSLAIALTEVVGFFPEFFVTQAREVLFEVVDGLHDLVELTKDAPLAHAQDTLEDVCHEDTSFIGEKAVG